MDEHLKTKCPERMVKCETCQQFTTSHDLQIKAHSCISTLKKKILSDKKALKIEKDKYFKNNW